MQVSANLGIRVRRQGYPDLWSGSHSIGSRVLYVSPVSELMQIILRYRACLTVDTRGPGD